MRNRMLWVVAVACTLSLTGCITINLTPEATPSASSSSTSTDSPTPTPASAPQLAITIDGIEYSHDNTTQVSSYDNGAQMLALFQSVSGVMPASEFIPQPFTTDVPYAQGYDWGFAYVTVFDHSGSSIVRIKAAEANGVPIKTKTGGISVGSTTANVVAAGGWISNPGFSDQYGLDSREVPGMDSLVNVGEVGIEYIGLFMESGKVKQIMLLDNDFSDI